MFGHKDGSINLFISVALVIVMFILVSLPGFAGTSTETSPPIYATLTPTIYPYPIYGNQSDPNYRSSAYVMNSTSSLTPTALYTYTFPLTDTVSPSPTYTSTPTFTPTPTFTSTPVPPPTETPTLYPTQFSYLPYLYREHFNPTYTPTPTPPPPETVLYCDNLSQPVYIPDNNSTGISDEISISDGRQLVNLSVYLNISHSWVGDLVVTLTNQHTGEMIAVLDRPGIPNNPYGCSNDNIITVLDDAVAQPAEDQCAVYPKAISGIYLPDEALSSFAGRSVTGTWELNVSDRYPSDAGWLNGWCLETFLSDTIPAPTPTPTLVSLPLSAYVDGMSGQNQQLPLDCESRSAVDWAKHFGLNIDEFDFLYNLPASDDPESGFVGDPNGTWGNIPPDDYGVHAPPIADLLRDYGLTARSYRSLQWDDLRAEIASGNPVIVWIIGGSTFNLVNGIPYFYTPASTGNTTIVAPYEHTAILVGYSPTEVTVLNGSHLVDHIPLDQFLDSWSVLQFMAVLARP